MSGASDMGREFIQSGSKWEELAGYSRAVIDGEWVFVSGTLGQVFATGEFPATAAQQCEVALDTIESALSQAHSSLADVVRVRVYVPDRDDVVPVSQECFADASGNNRPAEYHALQRPRRGRRQRSSLK